MLDLFKTSKTPRNRKGRAMNRQLDSIAVVAARFQVPELHPGHRHLIDKAIERHRNVLIVLGDHGGLRTAHDPLTFDERKEMVLERYVNRVQIERLRDHPWSHERWSVWLDEIIESRYRSRPALLFHSRQSALATQY